MTETGTEKLRRQHIAAMAETPEAKLERQQKLVADGMSESYRINADHWRDQCITAQNECNKLKGALERAQKEITVLEADVAIQKLLLDNETATNKELLARLQKVLTRLTARGDELPLEPATRGRTKLFKGGK